MRVAISWVNLNLVIIEAIKLVEQNYNFCTLSTIIIPHPTVKTIHTSGIIIDIIQIVKCNSGDCDDYLTFPPVSPGCPACPLIPASP